MAVGDDEMVGDDIRASRSISGIAEVARAAGVSKMTVSRVINDKPGVGEKTRERVRAIMQELRFQPSPTARTLRTGRPSAIGIVCLATTLYGPATTLFGVEQAARAAGFSVNVISLNTLSGESLAQAMAQLRQVPVAAVVIISPLVASADPLRELPDDIPTIAIWAPTDVGMSVATVDHERAAAAATNHLLSLGHRSVWHISGPLGWTGAEYRIAGWRRAQADAGRTIPDPIAGDWSAQSGYAAAHELLDDPSVTAIFAANDQMALGVLQAARVRGIDVPGRLSLVGYDDGPDSAFYSPPLTTVHQDFGLLGERALNLALAKIGMPHEAPQEMLEPVLVIRETTGPAPAIVAER